LCWISLALAHFYSGRGEEAWAAVESAEPLVGNDLFREAIWLMCVGPVVQATDPGSVTQYTDRFSQVTAQLGAPLWIAFSTGVAGFEHLFSGRPLEALRAFDECLRLCEDTGTTARTVALLGLAMTAPQLDSDEAPIILRDALAQLCETNNWSYMWQAIENLAIHWVRTGAQGAGAVVLGHLEAHGRANAMFVIHRAQAADILRAHPETADAQARGAAMTRDQLVAYILDQLDEHGERTEHIPV
jgi:hypothetical protein